MAAPITRMVEAHPPDVQEQTWNAITEAIREHAAEDGTVRFANLVLLASGTA